MRRTLRWTRSGRKPEWRHLSRLLIAVVPLFVLPSPPQVAGQEVILTLDEAVKTAIVRFPALKASLLEVEAAKGRITSRGSFPNPKLELKRDTGFGFLEQTKGTEKEDAIELVQDAETFVQWWVRRKKASWELSGKEASYRRDLADLVVQVKTAYFEVLRAEAVVEASRENLSVAEALLRAAKRRFELGDAPRIEFLKIEVEYTKALQGVLAVQRELGVRRAGLNFFLGRDPEALLQLREPLDLRPGLRELPALREMAATNRPEIREAQADVRARETQVTLSWMRFLPHFSAAVEVLRERSPREPAESRLTIRAELPIFDFGSIRGELRESKVALEAAQSRLALARQSIEREVTEAYLSADEAEKQVESFQGGILRQAEEILRASVIGYERGALTLLDVLEAQRSFRTTKTDYAVALRTLRLAYARLERALGLTP